VIGIYIIFAKQYHIRRLKVEPCIEAGGHVLERGKRVKANVRCVPDIMPFAECGKIARQPGHHPQPSPWFQHGKQHGKLGGRIAQMLRHLSGADEVMLFFKRLGMVLIKGVVQIHGVAVFLQHRRQSRARAAPEIEAALIGRQPFEKRLAESGEESSISWVIGIIFMQIILGPLLIKGQPVTFGDKDQLAMPTAQVAPAFVLKKKPGAASAAQGAMGCARFGAHGWAFHRSGDFAQEMEVKRVMRHLRGFNRVKPGIRKHGQSGFPAPHHSQPGAIVGQP